MNGRPMSVLSYFQGPAPLRKRRILVTAALVGLAYLAYSARGVMFPFLFALVLAYLLLPPVRFIEGLLPFRQRRPNLARVLAVGLVYLLFTAAVVVLAVTIFPMAFRQASRFVEQMPTMFEQARGVVESWTAELTASMPPEIRQQLDEAEARIGATLLAAGQEAVVRTVVVVTQTFSVLLGLAVIPVWLFHILKDQARAKAFFFGLFPASIQPDVAAIVRIVDRTLAAYIRAQLFLGLIVGVLTGVGLALLGVPFALVLGIIAGVTELIPILGPIIGSTVAVVVTLASAPDKVLAALVLCIGVQQIENNVLVPRVQGDAVQLHPAAIMLLLVGAAEVAGFLGLLLVVPLAAVCRDVYLYLYRRFSTPPEATS